MTGAIATNFHLGSQSETLADLFFATFGPVTPVRRQDDYGLDLFCALAERVGQRSWVRECFSVQVKSQRDAWVFDDPKSIRWLVQHSSPIFLGVVDKAATTVEVFHTLGRFQVPSFALPARIALTPGAGDIGKHCSWDGNGDADLSAPIIRARVKSSSMRRGTPSFGTC